MSIAVIVVLILVAIMAYKTITAPTPTTPTALTTDQDLIAEADANLMGIYEGVMPCADCPGIITSIGLIKDQNGATNSGTFEKMMIYEERNVAPLISSGTFVLKTGTDKDANAIVYGLTDETGNTEYWKAIENGLMALDIDGNEINSTLDITLILKVKGLAYTTN